MKKLGFSENEVIKEDYRQVFEEYCEKHNLEIKNMTFEEEKLK